VKALLGYLVLALACAGPTLAQDKLYVQFPATYDPGAYAVRQVKERCQLADIVANQVLGQAQKRMPHAAAAPQSPEAGARVVRLTILEVYGIGGGGWTGPKALRVRADLARGAQLLGSFEHREDSRGGILGPFMGTCDIFEGIAETLGEHIAEWLAGQAAVKAP
jgi:hypothetical protein